MTSVASFDGLVCRDLVAGLFCFRHHAGKVVDNESRMRLACRGEILLDAQMDLQASAFKPAAAPRAQLRRLRLFNKSEDSLIERPRLVFPPGRHRNQDVIDAANWHSIIP